jgi:hypothetical protein
VTRLESLQFPRMYLGGQCSGMEEKLKFPRADFVPAFAGTLRQQSRGRVQETIKIVG